MAIGSAPLISQKLTSIGMTLGRSDHWNSPESHLETTAWVICRGDYLYERDGWLVEYHGIVKGLEDLGRDLICRRGNEVHVVQVKCWSRDKVIHEKHIFQLFGTVQLFLMDFGAEGVGAPIVTPRFVTTTKLSPVAKRTADWLRVSVEEELPLDKNFPMIKCNINQSTAERIYHLPFDQQYDRTKILIAKGERYVATVNEAEALGFRRAFRFKGVH